MSSSDESLIQYFNHISDQLNRYLSSFFFVFGIFGNILNSLILSRKPLSSNSCAFFFLFSSIAGLIAIFAGLTSRVMSGSAIDLTATVGSLCKLRAFILNVARAIAFWLIMLASMDRWLLSCVDNRRRQMSTLKNSIRSTVVTVLLSCLVYAQILYCYEANITDAPLKCYGKTVVCRVLTDLSFAVLTVLLPLLLIIVFGLMTISNIRQLQLKVQPMARMENNQVVIDTSNTRTNYHHRRTKKTDRQLQLMLLVQVILLALFTLPLAIQKLYATSTASYSKTALQIAIDNFLYNVALLLTFVANGMPFYIYTLTGGTVFRKALWGPIQLVYRKITRGRM